MPSVTPLSPPKEQDAGGTNQPLGGFTMYTSPYDTRNQREASVAHEVISNIAEFAVMTGMSFERAAKCARLFGYLRMVAKIHQGAAA